MNLSIKSIFAWSSILSVFIFFFSCSEDVNKDFKNEKLKVRTDLTHSYSNTNEAHTTHLHLDLDVSFKDKSINGIARHSITNNGADTIIFDVKNLNIQKVTLGKKEEERDVPFSIGENDDLLGAPLYVIIDKKTESVNIYYNTTDQSDAIDWLPKSLTAGKEYPFMYTQGEALLTRSWIPIQDVPSNRITYSSNVKVPSDLLALMSASNPKEKSKDGNYSFEMKQPIPCYLIALAVGNISYRKLGENCGVYAEPELIEDCAYEFVDLPKMMNAAEKIYGKYQWDIYDLLVLPYSFPFGGMENPRLTFISPTLIAGDRSLVSVIAHELAHSWSGNLVTNATWEDFWLNEGFTVYFENRIMEEIYGKEAADILAYIEFQELENEMKMISEGDFPEDTHLKLNLKGRDPDMGMTSIAYVKGAFFLKTLEKHVGRELFDQFIDSYFKKYAFKTITTEIFKEYLEEQLLVPNNISFNTDEWLYNGGIPDNCLVLDPPRFKKVKDLANNISSGDLTLDNSYRLDQFLTQEWLVFIRSLSDTIQVAKLKNIDDVLGLKSCGNSEIMTEWYVLGLKNGYQDIKPDLKNFLLKVGRRKYLEPIYNQLALNKDDLAWAKGVFKEAKNNYHFVSNKTIEEILYAGSK